MSGAMLPKKKSASQPQFAASEKEKQNIKVMARIRPMSKFEKDSQTRCIIKCVSSREIMTKEKKFNFDRVFKPEVDQIEVYSTVVAPMIPDVISGYNCTVFAYGQTGSGKTYTMTGDDCQCSSNWREDPNAGCIPRAANHIFETLQLAKNESSVKVSYLELYNEEIRDLLSEDTSVLAVYNDTKGAIFVQGLNEVSVHDSESLCKQLQKGILKRQTAPTLMNHQSSRSHTVFTITVHTRETTMSGEDILKNGKLNLVDLAGSENIARSGCKDVRALELSNINKSLLTLGRVIHALADKTARHIPYRESKLTRILQDSLGGHTKTCIIATVSPAATSYEETVSTLEYASRARDIKNTPTVNEKLTKAQMMQSLVSEIERLQRDLDAARDKSGFFVDKENYQTLLNNIEVVTGEKITSEELNRKQAKRIEELETIMRTRTHEFDENVDMCKRSKELLEKAEAVIKEKTIILKQEQFVSQAYESEASKMYDQAEQLLSTTKVLSTDKTILLEKLQKQYNINFENQTTRQSAVSEAMGLLQEISEEGEKMRISDETVRKLCKEDINDLKVELQHPLKEVKKLLQFFDAHYLKELSIKREVKDSVKKYIEIITERTIDMEAMLAFHFDKLNKFAVENIGTLIEDLKLVAHNYTYAVHGLVERIHKILADEDVRFNESLNELEQDILARQQEQDFMYVHKRELDARLLNQIKVVRQKFLERNYKDKGQKLLCDLVEETEKSKERTNEMIEKIERTMKCESTTISAESTTTTTEEMLTALTEFDGHINSLSAKIDECELQSQSIRESLASQVDEVSDVLDTKVNVIDSRFDFLMTDRNTFEEMFSNFVEKTDQILKEGDLEKFVPVRHEGDTPARSSLSVAGNLQPLAPRKALIEKFYQQRESVGDETISSIDFDLEDPEEPPNVPP